MINLFGFSQYLVNMYSYKKNHMKTYSILAAVTKLKFLATFLYLAVPITTVRKIRCVMPHPISMPFSRLSCTLNVYTRNITTTTFFFTACPAQDYPEEMR